MPLRFLYAMVRSNPCLPCCGLHDILLSMVKLVSNRKFFINGGIFAGLLCLVIMAFSFRCIFSDHVRSNHSIVIRYAREILLTVPVDEDRVLVIRDGRIEDEALCQGEENVLVIRNGSVYMSSATCPDGDCIAQGALNYATVERRPLGRWIICAPHRISVEFTGE